MHHRLDEAQLVKHQVGSGDDSQAASQARLWVLPTSIDGQRITLHLAASLKTLEPARIYPALAEGDGPIGQYRLWAKQFYPTGDGTV